MIFWTKIRDKMMFWRFPKSVSVLYNYGLVFLRPGRLGETVQQQLAGAAGCAAGEADRPWRWCRDSNRRSPRIERRQLEPIGA